MQLIVPYFWFLGLPFGPLVAWKLWRVLKEIIEEGLLEAPSARRFTLIVGFLFTIPCLFLAMFQLLGGYDRPDYPSAFAKNEPYAFAAWLEVVCVNLFAIAWIWLSDAVVVMVLLGRRIEWFPRNGFTIKVVITVMEIVGIAIWTFMPPRITTW